MELPTDNWHHFLRQRDLEQILAETPEPLQGPVLEIGCGDGYVTSLLRQHFDDVVPIDVRPWNRVDGVCIANAEALPFRDGHFRLVYSSNVLEHIGDLTACLAELHRVSQQDAMMIHTMPTMTWKMLQLALHPAHMLFHRALPRLARQRRNGQEQLADSASEALTSGRRGRWRGRLLPAVHGVSDSHLEELRRFRSSWWAERFAANGFQVVRTADLYLHSAYRLLPYRGLAVREMAARSGLSATKAYWTKKVA